MKDWIKNITCEEIASIYKKKHLWEKPSEATNKRILAMIDEYSPLHTTKKTTSTFKRFLLTAVFLIIILVPALFIINNLQNSNQLFLAKIENHVTFSQQNKRIQLKQGDRINKDTLIQNGKNSTCTIQYAEKASVKVYEESGIAVTENNKNLISFYLETGKIYISENINKDAKITINTQNAHIYATGTLYSVEYDKPETIIKIYEGTVHIETIPEGEIINLSAGEEIIINQEQVLSNQSGGLTEEREWSIKTVYFNPNIKKPIIGFDVFKDLVTATTEHSVICFTREENHWEDYIKDIIVSPPIIFNEKVFVATKGTIFCYDLYSGTREPLIKLKEKIGVGQKMADYNNNLFVIFPSGIYLFDSINQEIESTPFIYVIVANLPVIAGNRIYITSYISRNLEAYNISGELLWSLSLNDGCSHSPVFIDDYLYIATKMNMLYKVTLSGKIVSQKQIEGTIESVITDNRFLYVNTRRNRLFKVEHQTLYRAGFFDNIGIAFSHNDTLLLGEKDGSIKIITPDTEKEIELQNSFVTVFTHHEMDYYAGLNNGYIMRISKE